MCCDPGFVVSFLDQRQNTITSILRNPRNFGFSFKSPATLARNKTVSLSFETMKPGIGFSLTMKVLDDIFFKQRVILSTLKIFFFQCSHCYSSFYLDLLNNLGQFSRQFILFHLCCWHFSLSLISQSMPASNFSSAGFFPNLSVPSYS